MYGYRYKTYPKPIDANSESMGKQLKSVWVFRGGAFLFCSVKGNLESQIRYLFVLSEFHLITSDQESASRGDARRGSSMYIYIYMYVLFGSNTVCNMLLQQVGP